MSQYIGYENIDDLPLTSLWEEMSWTWPNTIPWVSWEKLDANVSTNIPDVVPPTADLVWRSTSVVWSATDHETITRTGWSISLANGTTYTVTPWSKVISWLTYFYYDSSTNTIEKTIVSADSIWASKLLVASANSSTPPNKASFIAFWTGQSQQLVTHDYIWPWAVDTANIALWAIQENLIAAGAITTTKIDDGAISTPKIATWAITANEIAANTITSNQILAWTITATEIATGAITSEKIAANTIEAGDIKSWTITTNQIASWTILAWNIAAGTITANEINTNTITTLNLTAGTIDGVTITWSTVRTAASGLRVEMATSGTRSNSISFFNGSDTKVWYIKSDSSSVTLNLNADENLQITTWSSGVINIFWWTTVIQPSWSNYFQVTSRSYFDDDVQVTGWLITTGNIYSSSGNVAADGNITSYYGNIIASNWNITASWTVTGGSGSFSSIVTGNLTWSAFSYSGVGYTPNWTMRITINWTAYRFPVYS